MAAAGGAGGAAPFARPLGAPRPPPGTPPRATPGVREGTAGTARGSHGPLPAGDSRRDSDAHLPRPQPRRLGSDFGGHGALPRGAPPPQSPIRPQKIPPRQTSLGFPGNFVPTRWEERECFHGRVGDRGKAALGGFKAEKIEQDGGTAAVTPVPPRAGHGMQQSRKGLGKNPPPAPRTPPGIAGTWNPPGCSGDGKGNKRGRNRGEETKEKKVGNQN